MSPAGATSGNQPQIALAKERQKQAKTVAVGCDRLPRGAQVRRGFRFESGRGLCKSAARRRFFVQINLLHVDRAVGVEPFMEPSGRICSLKSCA